MARRSLADSLKLAASRQKLVLSGRVNDYLLEHSDGLYFSEATAERIKQLIMAKPRDRRGSFSPSSSSTCHRRQVFDFLGTKGKRHIDADARQVFADGTWRHLRWQAMGLEDGWFTSVEAPAPYGDLFRGSMDGENSDEGWLFELKGANTTENKLRRNVVPLADFLNEGHDPAEITLNTAEPIEATFIKHWHQVQRYGFQTQGRYEQAVMIYEPKGYQAWVELNVRFTKIGQEIARAEMEALENYSTSKALPPPLRECLKRSSTTRNQCPYGKVCRDHWSWDEAKPQRTVKIRRRK